MIHVCSLAKLHATVRETGAQHVVSLMKDLAQIRRPENIVADNHLLLAMDDIPTPMDGYVHPAEEHVEQLVKFVSTWDRSAPLVVHCFAGISRSTGAAFITACALNPGRDEAAIAEALRAASPTAQPNTRLVALGDSILGRNGRMVKAVESIAPALTAYEAMPFRLDIT